MYKLGVEPAICGHENQERNRGMAGQSGDARQHGGLRLLDRAGRASIPCPHNARESPGCAVTRVTAKSGPPAKSSRGDDPSGLLTGAASRKGLPWKSGIPIRRGQKPRFFPTKPDTGSVSASRLFKTPRLDHAAAISRVVKIEIGRRQLMLQIADMVAGG